MKRTPNNSHMTLEVRMYIEEGLNEGLTITEIANNLCRYKSSITREIDRHAKYVFPSTFNNTHPCIKYKDCKVKDFNCYQTCKNLEINLCPRLTSSPHICNGCTRKHGCRYVKRYYKANEANSEYLISWKNDRADLKYTDAELQILNTDFYNLVIINKSIYHSLLVINSRSYKFKESSIYRQIKENRLRLKYNDFPRNRREKSKQLDKTYKSNEEVQGHTYENYTIYKSNNPKAIEVQMDNCHWYYKC